MNGIILVRHAEPAPAPEGATSHWTDCELSEPGRRQAALVAARLKTELAGREVRIVSSDLKRASQTADAIAAALGVGVETTPELREFNNGGSIGGTEEALRRTAAAATPDDGESWAHFYSRVSGCMDRITSGEQPTLVVVSHYGAMINIVSWWVGTALNEHGDTPVSFDALLAAVTVLRVNRQGKHTIERLNDTAHLREASLGRPFQLTP